MCSVISGSKWRPVLLISCLLAFSAPAEPQVAPAQGATVGGTDRAWIRVPRQALVQDYENLGYRLEVEAGARALVEVVVAPIESKAAFPLAKAPSGSSHRNRGTLLATLAQRQAAGENTVYGAASRILSWVGRNIAYDLDRSQPQDPSAVLERGSGYCTGIARLTVALLKSVGIQAREVAGYVFDLPMGGDGYHRWVEIHYPDRGWAFSDPSVSHHYVGAGYVRLASPWLDRAVIDEPALLRRRNEIRRIDSYPYGAAFLTARSNSSRRRAAALLITVEGMEPGGEPGRNETRGGFYAILDGGGVKRTRQLVDGRADFVALPPAEYRLELDLGGHERLLARLRVEARELATLSWP